MPGLGLTDPLMGPLAGPGRADDADLCVAAAKDAPSPSGGALAIPPARAGRGGSFRSRTTGLDGLARWFAARAEAMAFAGDALTQGRTGLADGRVRVSRRRHGEEGASTARAVSPLADAPHAARARSFLARVGHWSEAGGAPPAPAPEHAERHRAASDGQGAALRAGRTGGSGRGPGAPSAPGEGPVALASAEPSVRRVRGAPLRRGGPRLAFPLAVGG